MIYYDIWYPAISEKKWRKEQLLSFRLVLLADNKEDNKTQLLKTTQHTKSDIGIVRA